MTQRNTPSASLKLRRWASAGIAAAIAIVWTITSLIAPSLASNSQTVDIPAFNGQSAVSNTNVPTRFKLDWQLNQTVDKDYTNLEYFDSYGRAKMMANPGTYSLLDENATKDNYKHDIKVMCIDPRHSFLSTGGWGSNKYTVSNASLFTYMRQNYGYFQTNRIGVASYLSKEIAPLVADNDYKAFFRALDLPWPITDRDKYGNVIQAGHWNQYQYSSRYAEPSYDAVRVAIRGVTQAAFWSLSDDYDITNVRVWGFKDAPQSQILAAYIGTALKAKMLAAQKYYHYQAVVGAAGTSTKFTSVDSAYFNQNGQFVVTYNFGNDDYAGLEGTVSVTGMPSNAKLINTVNGNLVTNGSKVTMPAKLTLILPGQGDFSKVRIHIKLNNSNVVDGYYRIPINVTGAVGVKSLLTIDNLPAGSYVTDMNGRKLTPLSVNGKPAFNVEPPVQLIANVPAGKWAGKLIGHLSPREGSYPTAKAKVSVVEQSRTVDADGNTEIKVGISGVSDSGKATVNLGGVPAGVTVTDQNGNRVTDNQLVDLPSILTVKIPAGVDTGNINISANTSSEVGVRPGTIMRPDYGKGQWLIVIDGLSGSKANAKATINLTWNRINKQPNLSTTATSNGPTASGAATSKVLRSNQEGAVITDTVRYENVEAGNYYKLHGQVMAFDGSGNPITIPTIDSTTDQYASGENGTWKVNFDVPREVIQKVADAKGHFVVFETLKDSAGNVVATHADKNDQNQTITVENVPQPTVKTEAYVDRDGKLVNKLPYNSAEAVKTPLVDKVFMKNLIPGKTYTLKGFFVNQKTGERVTSTVPVTFQATAGDNEQLVKFVNGLNDDVTVTKDSAFTAYEYLYEGDLAAATADGAKPIARHEDRNDVKQTVTVEAPKPTKIIVKKVVDDQSAGTKTIPREFLIRASYTLDGTNYTPLNSSRYDGLWAVTNNGSVEISGIPAGASVKLTEVTKGADKVTWLSENNGAKTVTDGKDPYTTVVSNIVAGDGGVGAVIKLTNTYTPENTSFILRKQVNKDDITDGKIFTDHKFTFHYTCTAPDGKTTKEGDISINVNKADQNNWYAGTATVQGIAKGSTCEIKETGADIKGVTLTSSQSFLTNSAYGLGGTNSVKFKLPNYDDPCLEVVFNNYYQTPTGAFNVTKSISGEATNSDFAGIAFNVAYSCTLNGKDVGSGTLSVYPGASNTVRNIPLGAECKVNEVKPISKAGFVGPTVTYKVDGTATGTDSAKFKVESKDRTVQVAVDNAYKVERGTFSFEKKVEGTTDLKSFDFLVTCGTESENVTLVPNQTWKSKPMKLGTECTVKELTQLNSLYGKGHITWDKNTNWDPKVLKVTISKAGDNGKFVATNHFETRKGGFEMIKTVNSVEGLQIPRDFDFNYSCVDRNGNPVKGKSGKFNLTADGQSKFTASDIPVGSTCTITETPKSVAGAKPADGTVSWTVDGIPSSNNRKVTLHIDSENQVVKVAASNVYTPENGGFTVAKKVDANGVNKALDKKFAFSYKCADGKSGSFELANNESKTITGITANSACTLSENLTSAALKNADHSITWNVNKGDATVQQDGSLSFKVGPKANLSFTAVNIYKQHYAKLGFKKVVTGDLKDANSKQFKFTYNCTNGTKGEVSLTNGKTFEIGSLPVGTSCSVTEDKAGVDGYDHTLTWTGGVVNDRTVTIAATKKGETVIATATNKYTQKKTSLKLVKKLDIPSEYKAQAEKINYEFNYNCTLDGSTVKEGKVELAAVNKDGITVKDIPVNANCTITETKKNITNLNNTGVTFKVDGMVSGNGNAVTVTMKENKESLITVEATNHYTQGVGQFTVAKKTTGNGAHAASYSFTYTCYADDSRTVERAHGTLNVAVGTTPTVVKNIPLGSVCDITEKNPNVFGSTATVNWDGAAKVDAHSATFVVDQSNPTPSVVATNDSILKNGTFTVKKVVSGDTNGLDPNKEFTFKYACNVGKPGEIKVKAGETKTSPEFPHGTICKVWEDEASAQVDGKTLTTTLTGSGVKDSDGKMSITINGDDSAKVYVEANNAYTDIPKIGTKLMTADGQSGKVTLSHTQSGDITLVDTVSYQNLRAGETYVFEGKLLANGNPNNVIAKGYTRMTVQERNGSVEVKFVVPANVLRDVTKVVAFEKAWLDSQVVVAPDNTVIAKNPGDEPAGGKHEDANDANQTLTVNNIPAIGTTAKGAGDTKLVDAKGASKIVDTVAYYNLPDAKYVLAGILVDKASGKIVSGVAPVVTKPFQASGNGSKDVTFEIPAGTLTENKQYVVYEWLYNADNVSFDANKGAQQAETGVVAKHTDINSAAQTVTTPGVKTNAKDGLDNDKYLTPKDGIVTVVDEVSYSNLVIGKVYTVNGTLMNKKTNKPLKVNGAEVKASTSFQASSANGTVQLKFTVPASALVEGPFVAFEKLTYNGIPIGSHEDINDKAQTVYAPKLGTTATVVAKGADADSKMALAGETATVKDVVTYEGLKANTKYRLEGTLMDKATKAPVSGAIAQPVEFTTDETGNGKVEMTFTVPAGSVKAGSIFVAFESVYEQGSSVKIASHEDINSEAQTVYVPKARTKASANKPGENLKPGTTVEVTDVVTYTNLIPGKEYTVDGELMYKDGSGSTGVKATKTFTADRANGFVTLVFKVPAEKLQGKTVVAFESVKHNGREVAVHKDLNDEEQSVYSPSIRTSAKNTANNTQFLKAGKDATVVDTVTYEGLAVKKPVLDSNGNAKFDPNGKVLTENANYTVVGELMKVTANGVESTGITASKNFHPTTSAGNIEVSFKVPAKDIVEGTTFVVYEKLYEGKADSGKLVAAHEDPKDAGQTVAVPQVKTNASDNTDGDKYLTPDTKGTVQVKDVVTYSNLIPGKEYTITGKLHYKSGDKKGKEVPGITASKTFTPTAANAAQGSVELVFEVPASLLRGETVVAFEKLTHQNVVVGAHEDINDEAQTVYNPAVTTLAVAKGTDKHVVPVGTDAVIQDTVSYRSLKPGTSYTLVGTLMDKATGKAVEGVQQVTKTFTPKATDGKEVVEFKVPGSKISAGSAFVVFQQIREGSKVVAAHEELGAQSQTVSAEGTPAIRTSARNGASDEKDMRVVPAGKDATIIDTVSYQNLTPGTEYTVSGVLMKKVGNKVEATQVTASANFTPTAATGTVDVTFNVPASVLEENASYVVYEKVTKKGDTTVIASHEDPEDPAQTVTVPEIRTHATADNGKYITPTGNRKVVDRVTYTNLQVGKEYTIKGELMYQSGPKAGQGTGITASTKFTPANAVEAKSGAVELTFEVPADLLVEGPFVAFEDVYYKNIEVGFHKDIKDKEQTTYSPKIGTKAVNESDSSKFLVPGEGTRIVDTVTYSQLIPGKTYVLSGKLIDKSTCSGDDARTCKEVPGSYIVKSEPFKASETGNGSVEVVFYIPGASVKENGQYVVFEYLYDGTEPSGTPVTKHENPKDKDQTVTGKGAPRLATNAVSAGDSKNVVAKTATTIVDTVSYYNLKPETTYTVYGSLVTKDGKAVPGVTGSTTFKTPAAADGLTVVNGTVKVTLNVPADTLVENQSYVVFEKLYEGQTASGDVVASHEDPSDEAQTVTTPQIKTHATNDKGGKTLAEPSDPNAKVKVIDHVSYTNLKVGKKYSVSGELKYQTGPRAGEGTGITSFVEFTAQSSNGQVDLVFEVPASMLKGGPFVAFEKVYYGGYLVGTHEDLNDKAQTVYTPEIGTTAVDASDNDKVLEANADAEIIDTVNYDQLIPGETYRLEGTLMDKASDAPVSGAHAEPVVFVADQSGKGSVDVKFFVPGSSVSYDSKFVAFENLYLQSSNTLVASHKDINDAGQTVVVPPAPVPGKIVLTKKLAGAYDVVEDREFDFNYTCSLDGTEISSGTVTLKKDETQEIGPLPVGTDCQISEDMDSAAKDIDRKHTVAWTIDGHDAFVNAADPGTIHAIISQEGQSVDVIATNTYEELPAITTLATAAKADDIIKYGDTDYKWGKMTKDANVYVKANSQIIDRVAWSNIPAGEYLVYGTLHKWESTGVISHSYKRETIADGQKNGEFQIAFDAPKDDEPTAYTVYEAVYRMEDAVENADGTLSLVPNAKPVAEHKVMSSLDQTFGVPVEAKTPYSPPEGKLVLKKVVDGDAAKVADGHSFKFDVTCGGLDMKATPLANGQSWTSSNLKANTVCTIVEDKDSATSIQGDNTWTLSWSGEGVEVDPTTNKVTIRIPAVAQGAPAPTVEVHAKNTYTSPNKPVAYTYATSIDGTQVLAAGKDATVNDRLTYINLEKGATYTVVGTLMDKNTGKPVEGVSTEPVTFKSQGTGNVNISFTIPADKVTEKSAFVVFERVYKGTDTKAKPVVTHEDLKDAGQTVTVPEKPKTPNTPPPAPEIPEKPWTPRLAKTGADALIIGFGSLILLAVGSAIIVVTRRRKED